MAAKPDRMDEKEEINHAHEINRRRRWAYHLTRPAPESRKYILDRELAWTRNARVMTAKRVKLMSIRCGNQRFIILRGHFYRPAIQIEQSFMEMTKLDRIEAIDILQKPLPERSADHIKRMRRDREHR